METFRIPKMSSIQGGIEPYSQGTDSFAVRWVDGSPVSALLDTFLDLLGHPSAILDFACGLAENAISLADMGVEVIGIDPRSDIVTAASTRNPRSVFRHMDLGSLGYPSQLFDGIWADTSSQHLDPRQLLSAIPECYRVLKPGGTIVLAFETNGDEHSAKLSGHTCSDMSSKVIEQLKTIGFQVLAVAATKINLARDGEGWVSVLAIKRTDLVGLTSLSADDDDCVFCPCSRFRFHRELGIPAVGSILWGNDDLYVRPDIAPLMEGHLLVISSKHCTCFGNGCAPILPALSETQDRIRWLFKQAYDSGVVFLEHGPARCGEAGVCVNHAHLHCLPMSRDLRSDLDRYLGGGQMVTMDDLQCLHTRGQSYLYLEDNSGTGWAYKADLLPSQFFRQLVSSVLGRHHWRWQDACRLALCQSDHHRTLQTLLPLADAFLSAPDSSFGDR